MDLNNRYNSRGAFFSIGDKIKGQWKVLGVCGGKNKSGMGIVYVVEDLLRNHNIYAAKTFQPELTSNPKIRDALKQEAELWMSIGKHPNIVNVEYIDEAGGQQLFIFLEYIGTDDKNRNCLTDFLRENRISENLVSRWIMEFCCGMVHAIKYGLLCHRDLKPDNLMITSDGHLKITDFGLAKANTINQEAKFNNSRKDVDYKPFIPNLLVGTPGYIAPELILQINEANEKSDIYAFGLILHQIISGSSEPPLIGKLQKNYYAFEQENLKIRSKDLPPILNSKYDSIIRKCLAFNPEKRFSSFKEIAEAVTSFLPMRATLNNALNDINDFDKKGEPPDGDLVNKSISLYRMNKLDEALLYIRKAKDKYGNEYDILNTEGVILSDLKRYEEALLCLDKSISIKSDWVLSWSNKGRTLRAMGLYTDALKCYDKAIELGREHCEPWNNKANCLCEIQEYEQALYHYDNALRIDHNYRDAWLGKGDALINLGRYEDALECIEHAIRLNPTDEHVHNMQSKAQEGLKEKQIHDFHVPQKESLYHSDNLPRVSSIFIEENLSYRDLIGRIEILYEQERFSDAYTYVKQAKAQYGVNAELWNIEGVLLSDLGRYEEALVCLEKSIQLDSTWVNSWSNKGRTLRAMGRFHEAIRCYDRALKCDSTQITPWLNKGNCLKAMGNINEAVHCYEQAFNINPDDTKVKSTCGTLLYDLYVLIDAQKDLISGRYDDAINKANSIKPDSRYYEKLRDFKAKALRYLKESLDLISSQDEKAKIQRAIDQISRRNSDLS